MGSNRTVFEVATTAPGSALMGQPPNNLDDYFIVRGMLRSFGIDDTEPEYGFLYFPSRPEGHPTESKQAGIVAGMTSALVIMFFMTGARLLLRACKMHMLFGWDDWTILVACIMASMYPILQLLVVSIGGGGKHTWDITYAEFNNFVYYGQICTTIFYVDVGLVKVSITLFLRRIADRASKYWLMFCDVFLATLIVYILCALFVNVFICNPVYAAYDLRYRGRLGQDAICRSTDITNKALSLVHVTQGIILLGSPIIMLWTVRMGLWQKIRLFTIWAVGGLTVTGGLIHQFQAQFTPDIMWSYTQVMTWVLLDLVLGIVVASLPILDTWISQALKRATDKIGSQHKIHSRVFTSQNAGAFSSVRSETAHLKHCGRGHGHGSGAAAAHAGTRTGEDESDSVENMVRDVTEMGILRTDAVHVTFSSAHSRRSSEDVTSPHHVAVARF